MASSMDAPNPLRPYYKPPSIGLQPEPAHNTARTHNPQKGPQSNFRSSARDILSDLDYGDYIPDGSPSVAGMAKKLMDQAIWNYTSVLLAQPFEVAKIILQVHIASDKTQATKPTPSSTPRGYGDSYREGRFDEYLSDDSDNEPSYFTSTAPRNAAFSPPPNHSPERRKHTPSRSHSSTPTPASVSASHKLDLRRHDSLLEVISQLWVKESAWGLWKGTNSTFVYNVLLKTIESWTRSLLSALLNIPDPASFISHPGPGIGGLDVIDSSSPLTSLGVAITASGIAALILAPIDLIRTRLILTSTSSPPRAILPSLRALPSLIVPSELLPITLLHSCLPTLVNTSTPLILRSSFRIDPLLTPATYSISSFLSSTAELFLKLPLETILRRAQVSVLQQQHQQQLYASIRTAARPQELRFLVEPGPYKGIWGTAWFVVREEGTSAVTPATSSKSVQAARLRGLPPKMRKGQGVHGLWRGWRVGFWGLVGVWGAAAFGGGSGGEF
ncbi:mitochondrial carrier [Patellaria atrata CBS 101060]|uniref:Mitochondrial carrier n=1 Tax=Patellaria atrata CBS 101060 TaxID=1346257 RepID=A0A9P4VV72_9PEZI|nr:mitochondrial carrier [Patellaria atrata CBS 101060]